MLPNTTRAFTLLELMLTLTLMLVLLVITVPSLQTTLHRYQTHMELDRLMHTIYFARQAAIRYGKTVTLCPSRDGVSCGGEWQEGQILFVDNNNNGTREADEKLLHVYLASHSIISWHSFPSNRYLRMAPNGFSFYQNGTFIACPRNGDPHAAHAIFVSQAGRVRAAVDNDKDGIEEDEAGKPLSCDRDTG